MGILLEFLRRKIPPHSPLRRIKRRFGDVLDRVRYRDGGVSEETKIRFERAVGGFPDKDVPRLKRCWKVVLDAMAREARRKRIPMFQLAAEIENLVARTCRPAAAPSSGVASRVKDRLDILFVTALFPSIKHGGGLRAFDMITELADRGHRVSLYSTHRGVDTAASMAMLENSLRQIRLVQSGAGGFCPQDFESWLKRIGGRFDAIHYVWPHAGALIPTGRKYTSRSVFELIESCTRRSLIDVERCLDQNRMDDLGGFSLDLLENWRLEQNALAAADRVIAVTRTDAGFTEHLFDIEDVDVIPTALSGKIILEPAGRGGAGEVPRHGDCSALFIGNYDHYPNRDGVAWFLRQVHDHVRAALPSFTFVVAGAGDLRDLRRMAETTDGVLCLGEVDDLVETLRSARVCLAPLISGAGIRGKINQYSAARRPTVSTSIGASGMPYRHEESILIADDPRKFAAHIVRLLSDKGLYERMRYRAYEVALEHFSWAPHIRTLETVYAR